MKFTAPLTAITAAVVGVIVNLALFFAYHVWWPQDFAGADFFSTIDFAAAAITIVAAIALLRYKRGVLEVIGCSAIVGLGWTLLTRWL